MQINSPIKALTLGACLIFGAQAQGHGTDHSHDHPTDTAHETAAPHTKSQADISKGLFDDSQIQQRSLADWQGEWQSVYPYLMDGTLAPVMAHKAEAGTKTAADYRSYYETGYKTDVDHITIIGDRVSFLTKGTAVTAQYANGTFEILTYEKGNRGVRYVFEKTGGDEAAPQFIQFSDHAIAPRKADHYHLYWGNDRAALLKEMTNWPTYYPAALSGAQIVEEMLAH